MQNSAINRRTGRRGQIVILAIVIVVVVGAFVSVLTETLLSGSSQIRRATFEAQAQQLAESGIDGALWCLNNAAECPSPYTGETATQGSGSYTTIVQTVGSDRQITSTGTVNGQTKTIRITASDTPSETGVAFNYGVQIGIAGLTMANSSQITGNVYSNGSMLGQSGTITGDATVAGGTAMTVDQQQTMIDTPWFVGQGLDNSDAAQSFVAGTTNVLNTISVRVRKQGTPTDATIRIAHDISGLPATTAIGQGTLPAASVPAIGYEWINVTIAAKPELIEGSRYWIIFDYSCAAYCVNYYSWGSYTSDETSYSDGKAYSTSNWTTGPWMDLDRDLGFQTFVGGNTTEIRNKTIQQDARATHIQASTITGDCYFTTILTTTCGTTHPGSPSEPQLDMPVAKEQIEAWKTAAEDEGVITLPGGPGTTYTASDGEVLGPGKIDGNLLIDGTNKVTLGGILWVKGNFTMRNSSELKLAAAFGSNSTVLIADNPDNEVASGKVSLKNTSQILGSGTPGSYIMVLSTNRSNRPAAGDVAIEIRNSGSAAILYASQGTVDIGNTAAMTEVTGQGVALGNSAVVTYESGLVSAEFSTGPGGVWALEPQSWQEVK